MAIDLSQFHQVFFEESFEGLDIMESALMELDPDDIDSEVINSIFRSAHSIKGGSATFGFSSIAEFTHNLETLLDQVRAGQRGVSGDDVNVYLQSVDCMREMLGILQNGGDGITEQSKTLKLKFSEMLNGKDEHEVNPEVELEVEPEVEPKSFNIEEGGDALLKKAEITKGDDSCHWSISVIPSEDVLKTGNEITRLFRELEELGDLVKTTCTSNVPPLKNLDPESLYLSWELELVSQTQDKALVEEVFEWIADESKIVVELIGADVAKNTAPVNAKSTLSNDQIASSVNGWRIEFIPRSDILRTGNDPLRMIIALQNIGEIDVTCCTEKLPMMSLLDSEGCFLSWTINLISHEATKDQIEEIFEWVLDEAKVSITAATVNKRVCEKKDIVDELSLEKQPIEALDLNASINIDVNSASAPITSKENAVSDEIAFVPPVPLTVKKTASKPPAKVSAPKANVEASSIRVGIDKVDNLINMVGELVITQSMLGQLGNEFDVDRVPKLLEGLSQLEQNTRELQESVMRIRMLPISFAFSRFPRMVRDLSQALDKSINLKMLGEQTELDKTVMEKIGDPLVHLVRNAIDHGIESRAERVANGKSEEGNITLNAYHQGGNVVIEISDDGKGLDRDKLVAKALERGLVSEQEKDSMSHEQVYDLIFQPGFSTAEKVSDVSGRGVGMDVVRRNIQALNGNVEIKSEKGKGSKITIRLPLTLAILDGQLVRVGRDTYIFPLVSIVESLQIKKEFISHVAGGCSVFKLRDDYVPIIELHKTFSIQPDSVQLDQSLLVVVEFEGDKVGVVVDELQAQQQVVIKSLEQNYKRIDGISGATILGDGTVSLILDIGGIVKLAGEKFVEGKSKLAMNSVSRMSNITSIAI